MENLTNLLEQLALKLGTTVEYLWEVLVKQAHIVMIQDIIWFCICVIVLVVFSSLIKKFSKMKDDYGDLTEGAATFFIFGGIFSFASIVGLIVTVN
ncbi:unnamed protein product, partial [marine sediment metagenome]